MKIPYIALYPAPFIADTYHLGNTELGIYWRLLLHYYQHLQPLPYDLDKVCRIAYATAPEERKAVEFILIEFFAVDTDGEGSKVWRHHRADDEIERALERHEKAMEKARIGSEYGRKSAETRREKYGTAQPIKNHPEGTFEGSLEGKKEGSTEGLPNNRERDLDLDQDLDTREREEGSLSKKHLYKSKKEAPDGGDWKMPAEWVEVAALDRPDLTREQVIRAVRKFEIHYQGSPITPEMRFTKWKKWIVDEYSNGGNGHGLNGQEQKPPSPPLFQGGKFVEH